jgi:hypothetical protein
MTASAPENSANHSPIDQKFSQADAIRDLVESTGDHEGLTPVERLDKVVPELLHLTQELRDGIIDSRWDSIISDDVSARIPALIIRSVIKQYAMAHNASVPDLFFVAGGRDSVVDSPDPVDHELAQGHRIANMQDAMKDSRSKFGERTLLLSDVIVTEDSLMDMAEGLHDAAVKFDIAILHENSNTRTGKAEYSFYEGAQWYGGGADQWGNTPLYASPITKPRLRAAIGVEKYDDNVTSETVRAHELREADSKNGAQTPEINPDIADLRRHADDVARAIYTQVFEQETLS